MPYFNVQIDKDDLLEELSDEDLVKEVRRRKIGVAGVGPNYSIPQKIASYTLDEAAAIFRKMDRRDLAFKLDEIKVDFIEH